MANASTLFRFRIHLSNIDRGVYENFDFRVAQHPSESLAYLVTRVLAYALNYESGLEFSKEGLGDPDHSAIHLPGDQGDEKLLIEIGSPSARRLHRAAKSARTVKVYTYKDVDLLLKELRSQAIYNADRVEIYSVPMPFLNALSNSLQRDNSWTVMYAESSLSVSTEDFTESTEVTLHTL